MVELQCIDLGYSLPKGSCTLGRGYFLLNQSAWGASGLFITCFLRDEGEVGASPRDLCLPPLTIDDLATFFMPAEIETLPKNKKALCGFNFIAYATYEKLQARFGGIVATSYEIEWERSSYAANAQPGLDYSLLLTDTHALAQHEDFEPIQFPRESST